MIGRWHENPEDRLEVLKLFLYNGQDVNAIGQDGKSMLIMLVLYKHTKLILYLLESTAIDLNIKLTKDIFGGDGNAYKDETAIDIARREKMDDIVAMLDKVKTLLQRQL